MTADRSLRYGPSSTGGVLEMVAAPGAHKTGARSCGFELTAFWRPAALLLGQYSFTLTRVAFRQLNRKRDFDSLRRGVGGRIFYRAKRGMEYVEGNYFKRCARAGFDGRAVVRPDAATAADG